MDVTADIRPDIGLGGLLLGSEITLIIELYNELLLSVEHRELSSRYKFKDINIWVENNLIYMIMAHSGYKGKVHNLIGIGSTLNDVNRELGEVTLINENYVVVGLPGIFFEPLYEDFDAPIKEIYVFHPDFDEIP